MRRFAIISGVGLALAGLAVADQVNSTLACNTSCPSGTRLSTFESTEFAQAQADSGAFLFVTDDCESFCEPVTPCRLPNVPVVDASGFRCQLLSGLSDFDAVDDLDLSFGLLWDAAVAEVEP